MNFPRTPPPLPTKAGTNNRIIITICVVLAIVVVVFGVLGGMRFGQLQQTKRAALNEMKKTADEARAKIQESVKDGNVAANDAALGRLKDQFGKSASALGGSDAEVARVMAGFIAKIQLHMHTYGAALDRLKKEQIMSFKIHDRGGLEQDRQIVREFLESNTQLTTFMEHGEDLIRTNLEAAKVRASVIEATLQGYRVSQKELPLQLRIRGCDKTLGETALAVLDLLDKNWGKWERDAASGRLSFDDHQTLETYNALIQKIQATAAEEEKVQQEVIAIFKSTPAK